MSTPRPSPVFNKGDAVRVVDTPYDECPFTWVSEMDKFCGMEVTIAESYWFESRKAYGYYIKEDKDCFTWCENCFEPQATEIEESEISTKAFLGI